ncbi:MAG: hypothetical protein EBR82_87640 [Caulobacteraceae bacterium]|nr:hypothetical protein [Caulobacteraceae bacterium]
MSEIEKLLKLLSEQQAKEQMMSKPTHAPHDWKGALDAKLNAVTESQEQAEKNVPVMLAVDVRPARRREADRVYSDLEKEIEQGFRKKEGSGEFAFPNAIGMDENDPDYPKIRKTLKK